MVVVVRFIVVFTAICFIIYYLSVYTDTTEDRCADYCYPNQSDLMDTGTCACWGYKIEIIDIEDLP